nr:SAM-dependent chlorinase/fluorinase [uncultured Desulfobulbus sp.]
MQQFPPIITLITDFGLDDPYVGQMKGALLSGCPQATLVDISHAVPPWNIHAAAVTLATSYACFPRGTIHLVVVDPGVGSERQMIAAHGNDHYFVCPDNGILSLLLDEGTVATVHQLDAQPTGRLISPTFHGRDVMAPAAAALATGKRLASLGAVLPLAQLSRLDLPLLQPGKTAVRGQVLSIDHFGNVRTTIRVPRSQASPPHMKHVEICGRRLTTFATNYAQVEKGALLVLVDSSGFIEIAANQASATTLLGCVPGEPVTFVCT